MGNLRRTDIFTMLGLPMQEHGIYLHWISFYGVYWSLVVNIGPSDFLLGLFLGIYLFHIIAGILKNPLIFLYWSLISYFAKFS